MGPLTDLNPEPHAEGPQFLKSIAGGAASGLLFAVPGFGTLLGLVGPGLAAAYPWRVLGVERSVGARLVRTLPGISAGLGVGALVTYLTLPAPEGLPAEAVMGAAIGKVLIASPIHLLLAGLFSNPKMKVLPG
jgi:hypothetical protein